MARNDGSSYDDEIERLTGRRPGTPDIGPVNSPEQPKSISTNIDGLMAEDEDDDDITDDTENSAASKIVKDDAGSKAQRFEKERAERQFGAGYIREGKGRDTKSSMDENSPHEKEKQKRRRKRLLLAGGGSGVLLGVLVLIIVFLGSLKLPQLMSNITTFEFARLSRNFASSAADITEEKLTLDASDAAGSGLAQSLKDKYHDFRSSTWGKLDKYRPNKVLENMNATKELEFLTEKRSGRVFPGFERDVLVGVKINGERLYMNEGGWGDFFTGTNRANRLEFNGRLTARIEASLSDSNTLIRGSVAQKIRDDLGTKLRFWERASKFYRDGYESEAENIRLMRERTKTTPSEQSGVSKINEATAAAEKAADDCDLECLKKFAKDGGKGFSKEVQDQISVVLNENAVTKFAGAFSTIYSIALPICLIYDGSVEHSGSTVDANSDRAIKTYYSLSSAADQQKAGAVDAGQVGGLNDELGDISSAPSELRAGGKAVPADAYTSPEAAQTMDYSLVNTLFGDNAVTFVLDNILSSSCPEITDIKTALVLGAAETAAVVASGGTVKAGEETLDLTARQILKRMVSQTLNKQSLKTFAKTIGRDAILLTGGTLLAKVIVMSRMGNQQAPIANSQELVVQADQGGNLASGGISRGQFYGAPMSPQDVTESNYQDYQDIAYKNSQKSIFERYLDTSNPTSVINDVAVSLNSSLGKSLTTSLHSLFSKVGSLFSLSGYPLSMFMSGNQQKVLAASVDTNYHLVQWGWTASEQRLIDSNPDLYSPLNNAQIWESQSADEQQSIIDKYDKCFTKSVGTLLKERLLERDDNGNLLPDKGDCAPNKLGPNGPNGDEAFRYRLYKRNQATLDHLTSIQAPSSASTTPTTPTTPTPTGPTVTYMWPLAGLPAVSACWNDDRTGYKPGYYHSGLDIHAATNTDVMAAAEGVVTMVKTGYTSTDTGKTLIIKHPDGLYTQYQHLATIQVVVGQSVAKGQVVAKSDNTGFSTSPHLHFNIQRRGTISTRPADGTLNPLDYLPADARNMTYVRSGSFPPPTLRGKTVRCVPSSTDPRGWIVVPTAPPNVR